MNFLHRILLLTFFLSTPLFAQKDTENTNTENKYRVILDLTNVVNDMVHVTLYPPAITDHKAYYLMAAVIPGSYSLKNYGRFVKDFKAFDKLGNELKTKKKGINEFLIKGIKTLGRIEYDVEDSWDDEDERNYIFQPGGTNIDANNNFVINHYGFYGYFKNLENLPYEITVKKPGNLYGATNLSKKIINPTQELITAPDYRFLCDNPIMYSKPDTISITQGKAKINVAIYSANKVVKAKQVMELLKPIIVGLDKFFGTLPVDEYLFMMYFAGVDEYSLLANGGQGALEHQKCSFYFLQETSDEDFLKELVQSVAAHEFLHIITPLNIHSKEIANFDFFSPKMSKHLWLYEGVTEYFSALMCLKEKIITYDDFMSNVKTKMDRAQKYGDYSFTQASEKVLNPKFNRKYGNVYQKGALIAMLLDMVIYETSEYQMRLSDVIFKLSRKYGPNRPFDDDSLFADIESMTNTRVRYFLKLYVEGKYALPYKDQFRKLGWDYTGVKLDTIYRYGSYGLEYNTFLRQVEFSTVRKNTIGLREGDVFVNVNGLEFKEDNLDKINKALYYPNKGEKAKVVVKRKGKITTLEGKPRPRLKKTYNLLSENEKPEKSSIVYRKNFLYLK